MGHCCTDGITKRMEGCACMVEEFNGFSGMIDGVWRHVLYEHCTNLLSKKPRPDDGHLDEELSGYKSLHIYEDNTLMRIFHSKMPTTPTMHSMYLS